MSRRLRRNASLAKIGNINNSLISVFERKLNLLNNILLTLKCRLYRVKGDQIKLSLDYLPPNDFEMAKDVIGSIDMVKEVFLYSDKCGPKAMAKNNEEYNKDLKRRRV